ncbi:MAG: hypothetical protein U0353_31255 [Sandaracinus sp.]
MRPRARQLVARLLALGALAGIEGCSLLVDPPTPQIVNRCDVTSDCAASSVCEPTAHLCVTEEAPDYALRVEVTPTSDPLGGEPVPMLFDLGVLEAGQPLALVAPVQVPVQGTARYDGDPIAAQITFARRAMVDEPPLAGALSGSVAVRASSATAGAVDFVTQLPGGATYDVYVEPQSEFRAQLPPLAATLEVPTGAGVSFAIDYWQAELEEVRGVVLDASSDPQAGLLIRMIDPISGRTVSSATSTDDDGRFTLVVPRNLGGFAFRIRGDVTRQDSSALLPAITIDASTLMPASDGTFTLLVPSSDHAMRLEGRVELPATLGMNAPAPNAQVRLRSPYVSDPDTGLVGSLELVLTTDVDGRFVGYVLPGEYVVEIVSSDEDVGVLVDALEVLPNPAGMLRGQLYTLPQRSILGGTVQLADGEPVSGARVRATALGVELADDRAALLNRSAMGLSGAMGEFRLPLDVGVFDLMVEMPETSGYAWHVEHDFGVGGSSAPLRRVLSVRAPYRAMGTASFEEGTDLAGARLRLFAIDPGTDRVIEIGATVCDETGAFVALLPPALD